MVRTEATRVGKERSMNDPASSKTGALKGKSVAILATDGFEQSELTEPRKALDQAGAKTVLISPTAGAIKGWKAKNWSDEISVDIALDKADPDDYDAFLLPG